MITRLAVAMVLLGALGCAPSAKQGTFLVRVQNQTGSDLSAGLIKTGGPLEKNWDAPEVIAANAPQLGERHWGVTVPAGQTRTLGPTKGTFQRGSVPFLRVYRGDLPINDLLAISRDSGDRVAVALPPEEGIVTVTEDRGRLVATYSRP